MAVFTVRLEHALPLPTVEEMLTGLACQCVSGASWNTLPESRVVVQNEMAEEVTTGGLPDSCDVITGMTEMEAIADDEVVVRPVPRLLDVEVMDNWSKMRRPNRVCPRNWWICLRSG